jgi:uncharacterized membrane protein YbhN (UPF0104 family)
VKRLKVTIKIVVGILLVGFIAHTLVKNFDQLRSYHFVFSAPFLVAGFVCGVLIYLSYGCIWYVITARLGVAIPCLASFRVWMNSILGKYLPGKVWMFMGRVYFYQQFSRPAAKISLAILIEAANAFIASIIVFLVSLWFVKVDLPPYVLRGSIVLLVISLATLHPRVLEGAINLVLRLLRRERVHIQLGFGDLVGILGMTIVSVASAGIFLWLIINSITPLSFDKVGYLAAAYSLAGFLGLMAVFAPGGIGVQETALILILQSLMPIAVATVISILARVLTIAVELFLVAALNGGHLAIGKRRLEKL